MGARGVACALDVPFALRGGIGMGMGLRLGEVVDVALGGGAELEGRGWVNVAGGR